MNQFPNPYPNLNNKVNIQQNQIKQPGNIHPNNNNMKANNPQNNPNFFNVQKNQPQSFPPNLSNPIKKKISFQQDQQVINPQINQNFNNWNTNLNTYPNPNFPINFQPNMNNPFQNNNYSNEFVQNARINNQMNNNIGNPFSNNKNINKFNVNCSKKDCVFLVEYLCEICNELICSNCFYESHNGHVILDLNETLETQEKSFTSFESRFYEFKNNRNKIIEKDEYINKLKSESHKRIDELSNLKKLIDDNIALEKQMAQTKINFFNEVYSKEIGGKKNIVEYSICQARELMNYYENKWKKMTDNNKIMDLTTEKNILLRKDGGGLFNQFVISYSEINDLTDILFERMDRFNMNFSTEESISNIGLELIKLKGRMESNRPEDFNSIYENANSNHGADYNSKNVNRIKSWEKEKENIQVKNMQNMQNMQNNMNPNQNKYERFYFISPHNLSEIIVLSFRERTVKKYSISHNNKLNQFNTFHKFVNLGNSVLVTGGLDNKNLPSDKCYILSSNSQDIIINDFPSMNTKMSSHNIIFLEDRKLVFVCGGNTGHYAEIIDPFEPIVWSQSAIMNINRIDATLAYVNQKYIFCFGGENMKQKYNTLEYLDISNMNSKWIIKDLPYQVQLKASYSGLITLSNNKFLLCGGSIDPNFTNEVFFIEVKDNLDVDVKKNQSKLNENGSIFFHNSFIDNINISEQNSIINYNSSQNRFYEIGQN